MGSKNVCIDAGSVLIKDGHWHKVSLYFIAVFSSQNGQFNMSCNLGCQLLLSEYSLEEV